MEAPHACNVGGAGRLAMGEKIRILIVDDHMHTRNILHDLLSGEPGMEVAGEAVNACEAIEKAKSINPGLILMDLPLHGNGIEAIRIIVQQNPSIRILVFADCWEEERVAAAFRAGALGYLAKDRSIEELMVAIRRVYRRTLYLDPEICGKIKH
jgi:DNA-binding NarL/FixJ family response regulator